MSLYLLSQASPEEVKKRLKIAIISSCLPRQCGIATFSASLGTALEKTTGRDSVLYVALNDDDKYIYENNVIFEIEKENPEDYRRAAEIINNSAIDVVSLQHEFGIFGGAEGNQIVEFLNYINKPVITTLHTVLEKPTPEQNKAFIEVCAFSNQLIVMNRLAIDIMTNVYDIPRSKIHLIPHGVPDTFYIDPSYYKERLGAADKFIALTFGFLSPNKGIETVIEAIPGIVEKHPHFQYLVVGVTHPVVKKYAGEAYRDSLEAIVKQNRIEKHVKFVNEFVDDEMLNTYLGAADLVICPYHAQEQITSGVLSIAIGKGKAIISTPYMHAREVLADGTGILVNPGDPAMMKKEICHMIEDTEARYSMSGKAYILGQQMNWSRISTRYLELFEDVVAHTSQGNSTMGRVYTLPAINLNYLWTLTDDISIIQHTVYGIPDYGHYYSSDDAARAIVACAYYYNLIKDESVLLLADRYMAYLVHALQPDGWFKNYMDSKKEFPQQEISQDTFGRCLWGLGAAARLVQDRRQGKLAAKMLESVIPRVKDLTYTRAQAYSALGLATYLLRHPADKKAEIALGMVADSLLAKYRENSGAEWKWFEDFMTYDNARLPQALLLAYRHLNKEEYKEVALESLDFLLAAQYTKGYFDFIGNQGWYYRGREKAVYCQQPLEAGSTTETCLLARALSGKEKYLDLAYASFQWYLGRNRQDRYLYNVRTGYCSDGLGPDGPSKNEGAESTISFLLGLLALYRWELIGRYHWKSVE